MNDESDILDAAEREIGLLYLSRYESAHHEGGFVYEVHIEGDLLMSSVSPLSEREVATRAIAAHRGTGPLRILVGGLGLGYTAEAALESPRASLVRVVDRMDFVIEWLQKGLLPLSELLTTDPRCELVQSDMYADVLGPAEEQWDLIVIDIDHSPDLPLDPASLPFYTPEGQEAVKKHLAPGGVLAVWSAHDNNSFAEVLEISYRRAWREVVVWTVEGHEPQDLHNTLFFATDGE